MLTIIFGAGASFDSSPDFDTKTHTDKRIPLAKDLFSTRFAGIAKEFPITLALINRLRRAFFIEHELERIASETGANIPEQLMKIRRYIDKVITTTQTNWESITERNTVYHEFIDILQKWQEVTKEQVNFITFNYDTLLESSCGIYLKIAFKDMNSYVSNDSPYKLFKPHGSINWSHLVQMPPTKPLVYGDIDYQVKELLWTPYFIFSNENPKTGYYKMPAISVPTVTKTMFEFPNNHKEEMKKAVQRTTHLLVIGWRAEEKHFLKLWGMPDEQKVLEKIEVVNSSTSRVDAITHNLSTYGNIVSPNITTYSEGFSKYVSDEFTKFLHIIKSIK